MSGDEGPSLDRQSFLDLPAYIRRIVHFTLCEEALAKWVSFSKDSAPIRYLDSVVGVSHVVDSELPTDAFEAAKSGRDRKQVNKRFLEPIAALQDDDLSLPKEILFAFFSVYNLFLKYAKNEDIDDWLIVNQSLAAGPDEAVKERFHRSMETARGQVVGGPK